VLRTIFFFLTFLPWTILMMLTGLPLSLVSPDYLHNCARLWGKVGLLLAGVRLEVHGFQNVPLDRPVVFMPNHQSNFDIPAMLAGVPRQFRWLAKAELFRIPVFGLTMRRSGYIPIDRSDRKKSLVSMKEAAQRIANGTSVVIFPEGTRTADGALQPFKKGGFVLAMQSQACLVPTAILGSYEVMSKRSLRIRPGRIRIEFFPPLETAGRSVRDLEVLMAEVRTPIAERLAR
jgi:1-acyl-sn-glycerol-3-phosphate acyltransferase